MSSASRNGVARGAWSPDAIHESVHWRLKWAEDGLGLQFVQR